MDVDTIDLQGGYEMVIADVDIPTGPRAWSVVLIVALLAGAGLTGCDRARARAVRQLKKGLKHYQRGESVAAVEKMQKAAELDGDFAKPHWQMAQIYEMDLDQPAKAEQHYRQALELKPSNGDYAYALGRLLASQDKYEDAIKNFKKAVRANKNHAKAWFRLGRVQREVGENAEAVESLMKSIEAAPRIRMSEDDPGGAHYHALADLYVEFGFFDKAVQVYENGIANNPKSPLLYQGRGVAQLELERYSEAAGSFEKALKHDANQTTALFNLAVARQEMGQPKGAKKALDKFVEMADRTKHRARIAAAQGMMEELEKAMNSGSKDDEK